jgi:aminopeptidase N
LLAKQDPHSYANFEDIKVSHISLNLIADFEEKVFKGSATLTLKKIHPTNFILLDSRELKIFSIKGNCNQSWQTLDYEIAENDKVLGSAIKIYFPEKKNCDQITIRYQTSPEASGLQWLDKQLTATKQQPFMFSQSQALHGRSWIPMQDTPAIKVTYDAHIETPKVLRALMSANNDPNAELDGSFDFDMDQPISPYLIAIAIGDVQYHAWSKRTGVWAEAPTLEAAAKEFEDTEKMIVATEESFGEYPFQQYDLLILPPSFPYGGMENPRLSFITPTVIVGDKSLTSMISHELAHSWSGNLVTNAYWEDLWLNEGITSYLENRILEKVYGEPIAQMEAVISYQSLLEKIKEIPVEYQSLSNKSPIKNPDDTFSAIAYQKGALFIYYLEMHFGREKLDAFLKQYFNQFKYQTITTAKFVAFLSKNLIQKYPVQGVTQDNIKQWIFEPGIPQDVFVPKSNKLQKIDNALTVWNTSEQQFIKLGNENWSTQEWVYFFSKLPPKISEKSLKILDDTYGFSKSSNAEILLSWFPLVIINNHPSGFPYLEKYLIKIGRIRLIYPLYKLLSEDPLHRAWAEKVYKKARTGYHPLTRGYVDKLFKI